MTNTNQPWLWNGEVNKEDLELSDSQRLDQALIENFQLRWQLDKLRMSIHFLMRENTLLREVAKIKTDPWEIPFIELLTQLDEAEIVKPVEWDNSKLPLLATNGKRLKWPKYKLDD